MFVVTQEYVAFLFQFRGKLRNDLSHMFTIWILQHEHIHLAKHTFKASTRCKEICSPLEFSMRHHLHFISQTAPTMEEDHAIGNRKVTGQGCTTSDQHWIETI